MRLTSGSTTLSTREPYTPALYFAKGKQDPAFRTKLKIALHLVERAKHEGIPFRAVVADSFYGGDRGESQRVARTLVALRAGLQALP